MKHSGTRRMSSRTSQLVALAILFNIIAAMTSFPAHAGSLRIVAFGDSLTAGYMLPPKDAFPAKLEAALRARGHSVEIGNAGVSGDTTAAGLARFDWAVPEGTDAVILELGANDALRGSPPKEARANLEAIIGKLKRRGIPVLLAGMRAPSNWGKQYSGDFDAIFPALAQQHDLVFYPFFLDGIALDKSFNQNDGLHPNAKGIEEIVRRIVPTVEQLIERIETKRRAAAIR